jgi:hypothetical protein
VFLSCGFCRSVQLVASEMQHDHLNKVGLSDPEILVSFPAFPYEFGSCCIDSGLLGQNTDLFPLLFGTKFCCLARSTI